MPFMTATGVVDLEELFEDSEFDTFTWIHSYVEKGSNYLPSYNSWYRNQAMRIADDASDWQNVVPDDATDWRYD